MSMPSSVKWLLSLGPILGLVWWAAGWVSHIEAEQKDARRVHQEMDDRQKIAEDTLIVLKDIHARQEKAEQAAKAAREAEIELLRKLCDSGELEGSRCSQVQ